MLIEDKPFCTSIFTLGTAVYTVIQALDSFLHNHSAVFYREKKTTIGLKYIGVIVLNV